MDKPASRHFSVLIIDDEPQVTSELRELLENSGYRCVTSTHRESAIASFQADPNIGLVICDLYLGQDNGIRLIESLKEVAGNGRFFESIILTGHDGRQEVIEATAGCELVGSSSCVADAVARIPSIEPRPDLVLLDVNLGEGKWRVVFASQGGDGDEASGMVNITGETTVGLVPAEPSFA